MKWSSVGRGARYSPLRGIIEATLSALYRGDWPARLWSCWPGACDVDVLRWTFAVLPPGSAPLRLGYASDLHVGPTTPPRLLANAAAKLAAEALDVLLLGGDYVFLEATPAKVDRVVEFVRTVAATTTLAVLGNHDLWTCHGMLERGLEAAGAVFIVNRSVRLPPPHAAVAVIGLDDPWTGAPDADRAFADTADAASRVVLCHSPDGVPLVRGRGASVYVCGHTHGGQIALPWGPLYVPGPLGKQMPSGLHTVDGTPVLVSRGLGGIEIPVRTFAHPDVCIVTLVGRSRSPEHA